MCVVDNAAQCVSVCVCVVQVQQVLAAALALDGDVQLVAVVRRAAARPRLRARHQLTLHQVPTAASPRARPSPAAPPCSYANASRYCVPSLAPPS